ncbi:unnamed protein product [Paramecium sonneborni]|uniref:Uncharacterized protein n=1 Tax=Paramecium sonneborni TaxID=65129 RepID=A0A8S1QLR7_9CILI|nr:unnamed protein product [Paramecium sonneborni]
MIYDSKISQRINIQQQSGIKKFIRSEQEIKRIIIQENQEWRKLIDSQMKFFQKYMLQEMDMKLMEFQGND